MMISAEKIAELRVKHLEMLQNLITRMASYGASFKSYCITVATTVIGFGFTLHWPLVSRSPFFRPSPLLSPTHSIFASNAAFVGPSISSAQKAGSTCRALKSTWSMLRRSPIGMPQRAGRSSGFMHRWRSSRFSSRGCSEHGPMAENPFGLKSFGLLAALGAGPRRSSLLDYVTPPIPARSQPHGPRNCRSVGGHRSRGYPLACSAERQMIYSHRQRPYHLNIRSAISGQLRTRLGSQVNREFWWGFELTRGP